MTRSVVLSVALALFPAVALAQQTQPAAVNGGIYNATPPTLSDKQPGTFQLDANGNLKVAPSAAPSGTTDVNLKQVGGATVQTGHGTASGAQRVELPTDGTGVVGLNAGSAVIGKVGIDQTTPGTTNLVAATQSGTWTVQPGNTANTTPWLITPNPSSASGAAVTQTASSALAANLVVKGSAGNLYSFQVSADSTLSGAAWWIMIYDATSAPGDGAVTPARCYALPSGTTSFAAAFPTPVRFATGITIGVSTNGCFTKAASTHAFIAGDYQ